MDEAISAAESLLERCPADPSVLEELGTLYLTVGRKDDAEPVLRKCNEIRPDPDICILLFEITVRSMRFEEARAFLGKPLRWSLIMEV